MIRGAGILRCHSDTDPATRIKNLFFVLCLPAASLRYCWGSAGGGNAGSGTYQSVLNPAGSIDRKESIIGYTMNRLQVFQGVPYRAVALLIPFCVLSVHIAVMAATLPYTLFLTMIGLMVAYMAPPAGKETAIPVGIALGIPWWYMALSITMVDVETGLFMGLNFDLAFKIPFLGPILVDLTDKTKQVIEHHRWISGLYFFGIVLMVMVPVLGSGGIRGTIAGKLLGMDTFPVFLGILVGALIGCFGIALGSAAILGELCADGLLPAEISAIVCNQTL